ncbi:MAG: 4Fe-4S dicluster domain-containing protein [Lentisphaerae bacterium]|nr:4Fe-4S dicluster domain-containing protein [Lentisphaerota bacterium]
MKIFSLKNLCRFRKVFAVLFLGCFCALFSGLILQKSDLFKLAEWQFLPGILSVVALSGMTSFSALMIAALVCAFCGRLYCSWFCPLGLLQDLLERINQKFFRKTPRSYQPGSPVLRMIFFTVSILLLLNGCALFMGIIEPYSLFGKFSSSMVRQILFMINDSTVELEQSPLPESSAWSIYLAVNAGFLLALILLVVLKGRIFCNTLCPAGTILAGLAARSGKRLHINSDKCVKCRKCEKACNANCINIAEQKIDFSRCFMCLECIKECPTDAISLVRRRKSGLATADLPAAPERRKLLITAGAAGAGAIIAGKMIKSSSAKELLPGIVPPGAGSQAEFLAHCTGCGLCIANCRGGCLQPATVEYSWRGFMLPTMKFSGENPGKCEFECNNCMTNCPTGALKHLSLKSKQRCRIGMAEFFPKLCIAYVDGEPCGACSEHCPTHALKMVPGPHEFATVPQVIGDLCIGCGNCQYACPVKPQEAIRIKPLARQTQAADPAEYRKKEQIKTPPSTIPF